MSTQDIDNAAQAFDQAMGNTAPASKGSNDDSSEAPEQLFGNLGEFTDNTEEVAGGDNLPSPAKKRAKAPVEDDEDNDGVVDPDLDDEDAGTESEDEDPDAEDEDDPKDGDDEGDDEFESTKVQIIVDGVEEEVTVKEAIAGYIRTQTFHKRMNAVKEGERAVIATAQNAVAQRNLYATKLAEAEELLIGLMPAEPDWNKLYAEDAAGARALELQYKGFKDKIEEIKGKRTKAAADAEEEDRKQTSYYAREEFTKFMRLNPKIQKQVELTKELTSMKRTALAAGFSEEEVATVYDSRLLRILQKASKYDRMMAAKPKPVRNGQAQNQTKSRTVKNGAAQKDFGRAQRRLTQTGSIEDAASVFHKLIS